MHAGATPQIFEYAKMLRSKPTLQEERMWQYLKTKPSGYKFRRQHPFNNYVLDFYCYKLKLSIEIDGSSHNSDSAKSFDLDRTAILKSYGVKEIRFSNKMVDQNIVEVIKVIEQYFKVNNQKEL